MEDSVSSAAKLFFGKFCVYLEVEKNKYLDNHILVRMLSRSLCYSQPSRYNNKIYCNDNSKVTKPSLKR